MSRRRIIKWTIIAIIVVWLLPPFRHPWTVSGAVRRLERDLGTEQRDWILRNPKDTVCIDLHFSLGMYVRNEFGLWGGNWFLMAGCGHLHPDSCSATILEALWHSVRKGTNPAMVRALDDQFQRVKSIQIDDTGFDGPPVGEVISRIQAQIDAQAATGAPGAALRLTTSGAPDLNRRTNANFTASTAPLESLLNRLAWRIGFIIRHVPPNLELVFK